MRFPLPPFVVRHLADHSPFFFSFRSRRSWKQAQEDGWVPGETLFGIEEAINKGTVIMNLLSDAAQSQTWSQLAPLITKGKTLYFSHGFSVVYDKDVSFAPTPLSPCDVVRLREC